MMVSEYRMALSMPPVCVDAFREELFGDGDRRESLNRLPKLAVCYINTTTRQISQVELELQIAVMISDYAAQCIRRDSATEVVDRDMVQWFLLQWVPQPFKVIQQLTRVN